MPPKANKKKKKSVRLAAQSTYDGSPKTPLPVVDLDGALKRRNAEWEASPLKNALIQQIRDDILSQERISIDNALCLGLGTMDATQPDSNNEASLYQLLVFETTLECLREKFTITVVRFQDPSFTEADRELLKKRGHTVLDWDPTISKYPMDPRLSDLISSSTLCFLPCLDIDVAVEVICAAKPSLYLGNDLVGPTASALLRRHERTRHLLDAYETFVLSCDFAHVPAFGKDGRDAFGFMWPAEMTDKAISDRILERNTRIIDAELNVWKRMDDWLAERLEAKGSRHIN